MTAAAMSNARIGGLLGIELKFVDYSLTDQAVAAPTDATGGEVDPATALSISAIGQGDGANQRDGRQVRLKNAYVTGQIRYPNVNASGAYQGPLQVKVFVALVHDKQTNANQLNSEDVFSNPSADADLAASPLRVIAQSKRFTVLDTAEIVMPMRTFIGDFTANETRIAGAVAPFKLSWKGDIVANYTGTGATVASQVDNSFHLIAYSNVDAIVQPYIDYNSRVRFVG